MPQTQPSENTSSSTASCHLPSQQRPTATGGPRPKHSTPALLTFLRARPPDTQGRRQPVGSDAPPQAQDGEDACLCSIGLAASGPETAFVWPSCGHPLHLGCLAHMRANQQRISCPICRSGWSDVANSSSRGCVARSRCPGNLRITPCRVVNERRTLADGYTTATAQEVRTTCGRRKPALRERAHTQAIRTFHAATYCSTTCQSRCSRCSKRLAPHAVWVPFCFFSRRFPSAPAGHLYTGGPRMCLGGIKGAAICIPAAPGCAAHRRGKRDAPAGSTYVSHDTLGQPHRVLQAEGGEQGDPLTPALFALAMHQAFVALQPERGAFPCLFG